MVPVKCGEHRGAFPTDRLDDRLVGGPELGEAREVAHQAGDCLVGMAIGHLLATRPEQTAHDVAQLLGHLQRPG